MASEASPIVTLLSSFLKISPTESFVYLFHVINLLDRARACGSPGTSCPLKTSREGALLLVHYSGQRINNNNNNSNNKKICSVCVCVVRSLFTGLIEKKMVYGQNDIAQSSLPFKKKLASVEIKKQNAPKGLERILITQSVY